MAASSRGMVRMFGVLVACAASTLAGLGLVFKLVTPESVGHLDTTHLLGLVGLLVLPTLVVLLHRRATADELVAAIPAPDAAAAESRRAIVVLAPDLRDRSGRRHRHRGTVTNTRATAAR